MCVCVCVFNLLDLCVVLYIRKGKSVHTNTPEGHESIRYPIPSSEYIVF